MLVQTTKLSSLYCIIGIVYTPDYALMKEDTVLTSSYKGLWRSTIHMHANQMETNVEYTRRYKSYNRKNRSEIQADCIITLLWSLMKFLFGGIYKRHRKSLSKLLLFLCLPAVYLLRFINVIKWRRLLDRQKWKRGFIKTLYRLRVSLVEFKKPWYLSVMTSEKTTYIDRGRSDNNQNQFWITESNSVNKKPVVKEV